MIGEATEALGGSKQWNDALLPRVRYSPRQYSQQPKDEKSQSLPLGSIPPRWGDHHVHKNSRDRKQNLEEFSPKIENKGGRKRKSSRR